MVTAGDSVRKSTINAYLSHPERRLSAVSVSSALSEIPISSRWQVIKGNREENLWMGRFLPAEKPAKGSLFRVRLYESNEINVASFSFRSY